LKFVNQCIVSRHSIASFTPLYGILNNMLSRYYDHNTRIFLLLGGSRRSRTIHRAVYGPGVRSRTQALDFTHTLIAREIDCLSLSAPRILDLGCGVGGSLFSLAQRLPPAWQGVGVSISPLQVRLARQECARRGMEPTLQFLEADFLSLPPLQPVHLAYAIESCVLNASTAAFFQSAAGVLNPGGRLVVVDDFLTPAGADPHLPHKERGWLEQFRRGWHAVGLAGPAESAAAARQAGFILQADQDLSPYLRLNTLRDRTVRAAVRIGHLLRLAGPYWDSLYGGDALNNCLRHALITYRCLTFEKAVI
jgi:SAM-dependent methyltransferase